MATPVAAYVCTEEFKRLLKQLSIGTGAAVAGADANAFKLPFPWSRKVHEADHCVLNLVPCDNEFELASPSSWMTLRTFRHSPSCRSPLVFPSTIPTPDELRSYYPDFVAVDTNRTHWLIETKGA
jgi:hypothetical protein